MTKTVILVAGSAGIDNLTTMARSMGGEVLALVAGGRAAADAASLLRGLCAEVAIPPVSRQGRWWDATEHGAQVVIGGSVWRRDRIAPGWARVGGAVWLDDVWFDLMAAQSGGAA